MTVAEFKTTQIKNKKIFYIIFFIYDQFIEFHGSTIF